MSLFFSFSMVMENKKEEREMIVEGGRQCQAKGKEETGAGWPIADQTEKEKKWLGVGSL